MERNILWYGECYVCTNGISSIHRNELPEQLSIHRKHNRSHTYTKRSTYLQDWCLSKMRSLSYSCDVELDDELFGKALSSPLFIQEREEPANLRQAYHSHEESSLSAQSLFTRTGTERPVHELGTKQNRKSSRNVKNERILITRISSRFW